MPNGVDTQRLREKIKRYKRAEVQKIITQELPVETIVEQLLDYYLDTIIGPWPKEPKDYDRELLEKVLDDATGDAANLGKRVWPIRAELYREIAEAIDYHREAGWSCGSDDS